MKMEFSRKQVLIFLPISLYACMCNLTLAPWQNFDLVGITTNINIFQKYFGRLFAYTMAQSEGVRWNLHLKRNLKEWDKKFLKLIWNTVNNDIHFEW